MGIEVIKGGLLTTVQDLGRTGYRKDGISPGGAMDTFALRVGNLLVDNQEEEAALECTLWAPTLLMTSDHCISLTGADMNPQVDGIPVGMWRPLWLKKGAVLNFTAPARGMRCYVCVHGRLDLPVVLGSKSTAINAKFGGMNGRRLEAGDLLEFTQPMLRHVPPLNWYLGPGSFSHSNSPLIRVLEGPEWSMLDAESRKSIQKEEYVISSDSNRMGLRLNGSVLSLSEPRELLSSAVAFGTVQLPRNGQPIILMADHQTTGGYPRIAQVIGADLPKLAQMKIGSKISFEFVNLAAAKAALFDLESGIRKIKDAISMKYQ